MSSFEFENKSEHLVFAKERTEATWSLKILTTYNQLFIIVLTFIEVSSEPVKRYNLSFCLLNIPRKDKISLPCRLCSKEDLQINLSFPSS